MKLKEINRTAMLSWSPAQHHPIYLASGTSAQQLDASFSTNASLEFFELNLADSSLDMKPCGALSTSHRYHKLVWSQFGSDGQSLPSGVVIAGGENGNVILYDPAKIMSGDSDVVVAESDRHTGPVRALDINPFQTNLIASGGNDSEIYIWDLNNFGSPMTPGPKTQPLEDISCVAWNRQVQHILASSSPSGRTSVWDLRKNDLIIKVSDHSNRMHCSGLAWNPEVATQLVMASEDDRMPVIQMWDLRFAASPLKILENHTRGVLAIAWSCADPELLLSCGKDGRILCWNPNTAEVLYELPTGNQWCFDIQWCPRNPAVFSAAGFDGFVNIYSIMGGTNPAQSQRHVDQISNSFSSMDPFGTGQTLPPLELPQSATLPNTVNPLKKPPKWTRMPAGASFAFGGKLVSLENDKPNPQSSTPNAVHVSQVITEMDFLKRSEQLQATLTSGQFVEFCQEKIDLSENKFEKTVWSFLKANFDNESRTRFLELLGYKKEELALKISSALTEKPAQVDSSVLPGAHPVVDSVPCDSLSAPDHVSPEAEPVTDQVLPKAEPVTDHVSHEAEPVTEQVLPEAEPIEDTVPPEAKPMADPSVFSTADTAEAVFDLIAAAALQPSASQQLQLNPDTETTDEAPADVMDLIDSEQTLEPVSAPVQGKEETLEVSLEEETTPLEDGVDELVDQAPDGLNDEEQWEEEEIILDEEVSEPVNDLLAPSVDVSLEQTEEKLEEPQSVELNGEEVLQKPVEGATPDTAPENNASLAVRKDVDGLITQALLTGDFEGAVELCLHDNRMADGIILAIAGGSELLEKTQKKYFQKSQSKLNKLLSAVVMKDLGDILESCELQNWKEALAAVMTYAQPQEFFSFCDLLGDRLEAAKDAQLQAQACLCYICAGNVEKLVSCWTKAQEGNSPLVLQDLVEKVVVMKHAVEQTQKTGPVAIGVLLSKSMSDYANLLASQGCLSTAVTYLPDQTDQFGLTQLRQRLIHALGRQETPPHSVPSKEPPALSKPNNPYSAVPPSTTTAAQLQYYQPVRAASTVTSWSDQTPTAFPPVPNPLPSGTASDQSKVEPPNSLYGMAAPVPAAPSSAPVMYSHQYQTYPQVNPQGAGGLSIFQPQHYSSVAPAPSQAPAILSQYSIPSHSAYPPAPLSSQHPSFASPSNPPLFSTSSSSSLCPLPTSAVASFQHSGPDGPGSHQQPPPLPLGSAPLNGWNDPPTLSRAPKKKLVPQNYTPPAPITAPITAPLGGDPQVHHATSGSQQFMGQVPPAVQAQYPSIQQPQAPPAVNSVPKTSTEGPPGAPTGDVIQPLRSMPAEKITKKPIPDEHLVLKTTFEGLIQKCLAVANDPQTKRKLDDANKRMEALYDKLREQTLSPAIVSGLHNIARTVDSRSYAEGLNLHTLIVSSSNFSEISGFMPVLKVVLTQANRLGV